VKKLGFFYFNQQNEFVDKDLFVVQNEGMIEQCNFYKNTASY